MYAYMYTCINSVYFMVPSCRQLLCALSNQKGKVNYDSSGNFPSITYLYKQKIVGEWPIMSLAVLIAQTECKSSANSLHLYELLFPLSSLRQEAAIHSASLVYLHYVDPHTILPLLFTNSRLDHRFKKSWLVLCIVYVFPHVC